MVRPYEVVYIFDSTLEDEAITQKLAKVHELIHVDGTEPPVLDVWGRHTLAYPIGKHTTGYYVVANFDTDPVKLPEFERALRLDDTVVRFLVVLNDEPPTPAQVPVSRDDEEED